MPSLTSLKNLFIVNLKSKEAVVNLIIKFVTFSVAIVGLVCSSRAANITEVTEGNGTSYISVDGEIQKGDLSKTFEFANTFAKDGLNNSPQRGVAGR